MMAKEYIDRIDKLNLFYLSFYVKNVSSGLTLVMQDHIILHLNYLFLFKKIIL